MRRRWLLLTLLCGAGPAFAQVPDDVPALMRAGRWAEADAAAASYADPVARQVVLYERLLTPGAARAGEIASFLKSSPTWPRAALLNRLDAALAEEADDSAALAVCDAQRPEKLASRLRCAKALLHAGRSADAAQLARDAWVATSLDADGEARLLADWSAAIAPGDQRARFEFLAWKDSGKPGSAASRQAARLAPADRPAAAARLALLRDDPAAPALVAKLSPDARKDPGLVLALLRWMRRGGQEIAAADLWPSAGAVAERSAPEERRALFWREREALARELLDAGDATRAFTTVSGAPSTAESEFLSGWIALRRLGDASAAARHFTALLALSPAAITQARAQYWMGRAQAALGDGPGAQAAFGRASRWLTTFYGQLAAREALGPAHLAEAVRSARDPAWTGERAGSFVSTAEARAALLLAAWGEPARARAFLAGLAADAPDEAGWSLAAHLASELQQPDLAVALARQAGQRGLMLPDAGWPAPVTPPGIVDGAAALGVMRQESSFDPDALSSAGAQGLMQLMPATAAAVARSLGAPSSPLTDPSLNMRLGTTYLAGLLRDFDGALPVALAAYNAGPNRARAWLAGREPKALDIVDWIELIPFDETRNYVQRCMEGFVIYEARQGGTFKDPWTRWLG